MTFEETLNTIKTIGSEMPNNQVYKTCPYSASKIISTLQEPFDKEAIAQKTYDKHYEDTTSKYYHMSVFDIITLWDKLAEEGKANGRTLDSYIGLILEPNKDAETKKKKLFESALPVGINKCKSFDEFYKDNIVGKLHYIAREKTMIYPSLKLNGRFDAIFYTDNHKLLLIDWKNTKEIKTSNKWQKLKGPMSEYDDCELNVYTIQLYLYVYILRHNYNIIDFDIIPLVVRMGENGDYGIFYPEIKYSDSLIESVISYAISQLNK